MTLRHCLECDICFAILKPGLSEQGWKYYTIKGIRVDICPECTEEDILINDPKENDQLIKDLIDGTLKEVDEDGPSNRS